MKFLKDESLMVKDVIFLEKKKKKIRKPQFYCHILEILIFSYCNN